MGFQSPQEECVYVCQENFPFFFDKLFRCWDCSIASWFYKCLSHVLYLYKYNDVTTGEMLHEGPTAFTAALQLMRSGLYLPIFPNACIHYFFL